MKKLLLTLLGCFALNAVAYEPEFMDEALAYFYTQPITPLTDKIIANLEEGIAIRDAQRAREEQVKALREIRDAIIMQEHAQPVIIPTW